MDQNNNEFRSIWQLTEEFNMIFLKLQEYNNALLSDRSELFNYLEKLKLAHNAEMTNHEIKLNNVKEYHAKNLNKIKAFEEEKIFVVRTIKCVLDLLYDAICEKTYSVEAYKRLEALYDILKRGMDSEMPLEKSLLIKSMISQSTDSVVDVADINISSEIFEIEQSRITSATTPKVYKTFLSCEDPCLLKRKSHDSLNELRRKLFKFAESEINESVNIKEEIIEENKIYQVNFENIRTDQYWNSTFIDTSLLLDNDVCLLETKNSQVSWEEEQVTSLTPIKSPFRPLKNVSGFIENRRQALKHMFIAKKAGIMKQTTCACCNKRINPMELFLKCKTCNSVCHHVCSDYLPILCVPMATPSKTIKDKTTTIADHTPLTSPMVPALIVYCTIEIENRGLNMTGIYRKSGSKKEVVQLKEHFLRGRGIPNLKKKEVHVLCCTIKEFLLSLKEPLITLGVKKDFERAVQLRYGLEMFSALSHAVNEMPQPNRDTLAWLMRHLKRVCEVEENKMSLLSICTVFAPTLIVSHCDIKVYDHDKVKKENELGIKLVKALLDIEMPFWENLIQGKENNHLSKILSPSTFSRTSSKRRSILSWSRRK